MSKIDNRKVILEAALRCGPAGTNAIQAAGTIKPGADIKKEPPGS